MYAIVKAGGKQYRVQPGDVLRVEKLDNVELGSELELKDVLMVGGDKTFVGAPLVKDASVTVVVTNQQRGPKVVIFKKKRRQGYRRMGGHRQPYTELFVKAITGPEGTSKSDKKANVYDAEKKAEKLAKTEEVLAQAKLNARKAEKSGEARAAAPKTAKKKVVKKAGAKKAPKKSGAKKKTAKKAAKK